VKHLLITLFNLSSNSVYVYFLTNVPRGTFLDLISTFSIFSHRLALFHFYYSISFFTKNDFRDDFYYYFTNDLNNLAIRFSPFFSYNLQYPFP